MSSSSTPSPELSIVMLLPTSFPVMVEDYIFPFLCINLSFPTFFGPPHAFSSHILSFFSIAPSSQSTKFSHPFPINKNHPSSQCLPLANSPILSSSSGQALQRIIYRHYLHFFTAHPFPHPLKTLPAL